MYFALFATWQQESHNLFGGIKYQSAAAVIKVHRN